MKKRDEMQKLFISISGEEISVGTIISLMFL